MLNRIQKKLLPGYFKFIGLLFVIIRIVFFSYDTFITEQNSSASKFPGLMEQITSVLFIIGLFFILMARMRIEDERTKNLRSQAIVSAFIFGAFMTVMLSCLSIGDSSNFQKISHTNFIGMMLLVGVIDYYYYKLRGKNIID